MNTINRFLNTHIKMIINITLLAALTVTSATVLWKFYHFAVKIARVDWSASDTDIWGVL